MLFLIVTVSWAAVAKMIGYFDEPLVNLHLIVVLAISLALEAWMIVEGLAAFRISRRVRAQLASAALTQEQAQLALAGPNGTVIGADGIVRNPGESTGMPDCNVC